MKVEAEVKLRDEQRRNAEATFKKYDTNDNGTLEPDEIREALIDLGMNLPAAQMDVYVTSVMKIYDDNDDGFLRLYEFEKLYSTCMASEQVREKYVNRMITEISDEDQMRSLAQHAFDKYDEDRSGTLDIAELAEVLMQMLPLQSSDFNEDQVRAGRSFRVAGPSLSLSSPRPMRAASDRRRAARVRRDGSGSTSSGACTSRTTRTATGTSTSRSS